MQNPVSHNLQKAETQTPFKKNETPKEFPETAFHQILSAFRFSVFFGRGFSFSYRLRSKRKNGGIRSCLNRMSPLIRVGRLNCNALLLLVQEAELQFAAG